MVPEKLARLFVSRQAVFRQSGFIAQKTCKFFPNLNIPEYRERFDEEKRVNLIKERQP